MVHTFTDGMTQGTQRALRLDFVGRKRHRRPYYTFVGRESVEHLKLWREKWVDFMKRSPGPGDLIFVGKKQAPISYLWLAQRFRETAVRLANQGLLKNGAPESWHSHALRHSFKTEAGHAGATREVVEFFMGHVGGVQWVYDHCGEVHVEDFIKEYLKVEPFVSLSQTEAALKGEFEEERRSWIIEIQDLKRQVTRLAG